MPLLIALPPAVHALSLEQIACAGERPAQAVRRRFDADAQDFRSVEQVVLAHPPDASTRLDAAFLLLGFGRFISPEFSAWSDHGSSPIMSLMASPLFTIAVL